jgi:hypothetical protein
MSTNNNRPTLLLRDAAAIAGILKRLPNVPSIVLGGATYTPTTLAGLFQSHIDAAKKVESDQGQYKAAIVSYRALSKIVHNALLGLREFVRQM